MKIIKIALAAAILGSSGIVVDARIGSNAGDETPSSSTFDATTADLHDEDDIEHRLLQSVDFDAFNPSVEYSDLSVKWAAMSERYVLSSLFWSLFYSLCLCGLVLLCRHPLFSYSFILSSLLYPTVDRLLQVTSCFMSRQRYSMHGHVTVMVQLVFSLILMVWVFVMQQPHCLLIGKGWHVCMPCVSYAT